ncbi:MAG TPA: hypothetical protein DCP32_03630 [Anaerolineaceae bacterium]|nr:hypothetical protein [Anaerolineaceae bacterium]HBA91554.1 hypothetical protein [Anaerolineaceae bacterium]
MIPELEECSMEFSEIAFFTNDVKKMTDYYRRLLGKAPDVADEDMAIFTIGGVSLLIHTNYTTGGSGLAPENHFAFKANDLDAACAQLVEQGLSLEVTPRDFDWGRSAYLRDPDGQLIELSQK